jgi:hypothetical protein
MKQRKTITLTDIDQVIAALGGLRSCAEMFSYESTSGVSNWKLRGIPPGLHYRIDRYLSKRGYVVDPSVFGYEDEEAA